MGKIGGIQKEKPSYEGHRGRLRKRLTEAGKILGIEIKDKNLI